MSAILPYFSDTSYINLIDSLNIGIQNQFSELINLNFNQMTYAGNAYAFRRRSDENKGNITLPFMNFKLTEIAEDNTFHNWQYTVEHQGIYIDELGIYVAIRPVAYVYESSFWCSQEIENHYTMTKLVMHGDDPNTVTYSPQYGCQPFPLLGHLAWDGLNFDSQYKENDWLVRNNIHNISMNFRIRSFICLANLEVSIPDTILFNFGIAQFGQDNVANLSQQQLYQMVIDHFNDTVEPATGPTLINPPVFP